MRTHFRQLRTHRGLAIRLRQDIRVFTVKPFIDNRPRPFALVPNLTQTIAAENDIRLGQEVFRPKERHFVVLIEVSAEEEYLHV